MKEEKRKKVNDDFYHFAYVQALSRCIFEMNQITEKEEYSFNDFKHDYYSQIIISDKILKQIYNTAKNILNR